MPGRVVLTCAIALCVAIGRTSAASAPTPPKLAQADAPDLEALKQRAEAARAAGRIDEAIDLYGKALRLQPAWVEGNWYLGTIYYDADRYTECRDSFARVVEQQPENGAALGFKGLCEFHVQAYTEALDDLTGSQRFGSGENPEFSAVIGYHRAILLTRAGQFEPALDEIESFVRGGNTGPDIVLALGLALLRIPKLPSEMTPQTRAMVELAGQGPILAHGRMADAAERTYTQLVSQYPDVANVHYVYGAYLLRDRPDQALAQFKLELLRSPDHVLARVQIAQELINRGQLEEAAPYARQAAALDQNNFVARKVLGQIELQSGDVAGAIADLEAARALEPSSPSVRFHLARAYQRAGRTGDAERERDEFKRLQKVQQVQRGGINAIGEEPPNQ
jgi:tetratricopeptide (TPR) repeat protein